MNNTAVACLIGFTLLARFAAGLVWAADEPSTEEIKAIFALQQQRTQAVRAMDEYARAALALDTNASISDRCDALESLATNPASHVDTLDTLSKDSQWLLRFTAIAIMEPARTDLAYQAARQFVAEAQDATNATFLSMGWAVYTAALLARMGDGSAMPFIVQQLNQTSSVSLSHDALRALYSFYYLKDLKPYEPIIAFIDRTLPALNSTDDQVRRDATSILPKAVYMLSKLHAIEALPDGERWQSQPMPEEVRSWFKDTLRDLHTLKTRQENGEPDHRDDPDYKRIPGVTPAWQLPSPRTGQTRRI